MTRLRIAVGSLGGTITMTSAVGVSQGARPTLGASDLTAAVPALEERFELVVETLGRHPSPDLTPQRVADAVTWARTQVDAGCNGVVLTQGTDTLAESAFVASLWWDRAEPLVFTGAMRTPTALSADGPANLWAACLAAGSSAVRDLGVVVVMNSQIHLAERVAKSHSYRLDAFTSGPLGVAGIVIEDGVQVVAAPRNGPSAIPMPTSDPEVLLWGTFLGDDGSGLRRLVGPDTAGVVVDGFGVGHVSAGLAAVLEDLAGRMPVVVASSPARGGTLTSTYGFPGSESDLLRRGVLLAGDLPARKARLLVWAWLAAGNDPAGTAELFG